MFNGFWRQRETLNGFSRQCESASSTPSSMADTCIICGLSDKKLAQCRDISSWTTLHRAAVIRNHKPILEASTESEFPKNAIKYHRNCRAEFTNKRDLQVADKTPGNDEEASTSAPRRSSRDHGSHSSSHILPDQCLFCKKSKYKQVQAKHEDQREPTQCARISCR